MIDNYLKTIEMHKFNLLKGTHEIEEFKYNKIMVESLIREFTKFERHIGLRISVEQLINAESFIQDLYEQKGYSVEKLNPNTKKYQNFEIINYLIKKFGECDMYWEHQLSKTGVPDFLIYKQKNGMVIDLFFLEVKTETDSLRFNQIKWIFENKNIPTYLTFCKEVVK